MENRYKGKCKPNMMADSAGPSKEIHPAQVIKEKQTQCTSDLGAILLTCKVACTKIKVNLFKIMQ